MKLEIIKVTLFLFFILASMNVYTQYNVNTFGAKGDGTSIDTRAIQDAIDMASADGGGVVDVPAGKFKIGTLVLKDNVNLHLLAGSMLLGSPDISDYKEVKQVFESRSKDLYAKYFMLFAENVENISISGSGVIHGNGLSNFRESDPQNERPFMVRLVNCRNISITGVSFLESANWTLHLLACKDVNVSGINIENTGEGNRDGLDIDACQRVTISDSRFRTTDDAIVMKATCDILCQDISITNCLLRTGGSAIKTGTESNGGFKNISVSNCVIRDTESHAGIELMTVDGGMLQNVLLENIVMDNVRTPIFIMIGLRLRPYREGQYVKKIEDVQNIYMNNIIVTNAILPSSIMGLYNRKIKNISINNYSIKYKATQAALPYNKIPQEEFSYPMAIMYRNLPAYGFYCRNVDNLHLENMSMYPIQNEARPALAFDGVSMLGLNYVRAQGSKPETPLAYFRHTNNVIASFCSTFNESKSLFEVEGETCNGFQYFGNSLKNNQILVIKKEALIDTSFYEDFPTEIKYTVQNEEKIKGFPAHNLNDRSLPFNLNINKRGSLQLCLFIRNDAPKSETVYLKYGDVVQEFIIDWNEWGWAPITLLLENKKDEKINFEIFSKEKSSNLKISKVYLRYQNIEHTD